MRGGKGTDTFSAAVPAIGQPSAATTQPIAAEKVSVPLSVIVTDNFSAASREYSAASPV